MEKAKELVPVLPKDDITKLIIKQAVNQLNSTSTTVESLRTLEQKNVPTSKRGSSNLRKTLFQVMDALIKTHPQDDPVYQFIDKSGHKASLTMSI